MRCFVFILKKKSSKNNRLKFQMSLMEFFAGKSMKTLTRMSLSGIQFVLVLLM